jgi:nucleoside-diphosphate-sugar epimerase
MKIFLAGATGAIGKRLVPLLVEAGFQVFGTTRLPSRAAGLRAAGVEPVVVDVFDRASLVRAAVAAHPDVVMQQLTDLPPGLDAGQMVEGTRRNARMRSEGTQNLVAAALEAGVSRFIAQSIAWMYAPGPEPHAEDDALDINAQGTRAITVTGVAALERLVLASPPTGTDAPSEPPSLHVDAAAAAALLAIEKGRIGTYNIAEPNSYLSTEKARSELGFDAAYRLVPAA